MSSIEQIKKIYPTVEDLSTIKNNVQCTEEGCTSTFMSESNLQMHLVKHHKREKIAKLNAILHFHCPDPCCVYNDNKCFNKIKYLKQHYLKIHAKKSFICDTCHKGFATCANQKKHMESCGIKFKCFQCDATYNNYESLFTHCKRKKHTIFDKSVYTKKALPSNKPKQTCKNAFILPKVVLQANNFVSREDKEIQTDPWCDVSKAKQKTVKRRSTQQTQTCVRKKIRKSAETQTTGQCMLKKIVQTVPTNSLEPELNYKKSSETQTKFKELKLHTADCNDTKSSETQTKCPIFYETVKEIMQPNNDINLYNLNLFDDNAFNNCETQTDVIYQDTFLQSNVFMSHIETQTSEINDLDLCSNTYTQTCNDLLFPEFGFNDIQTQTTWPDYDVFVSTETQTNSTKNMLDLSISTRGISHMETQTETEFKQLLEEINA